MKRSWMYLVALAPAMAFIPSVAEAPAPGAPVVAVLAFDNTSIGKDRADFDGIGKGIMDILITDLATNTKFRVVDRERIQKILDEQNLAKSGAVSSDDAIRVGKLFSACYSIYGAFMRDPAGKNYLTIHTTSNETGQITNGNRLDSKGDDVMDLITRVSKQFQADVKLTGCPGTGATPSRGADAGAQQSGGATKTPATTTAAPAAATAEYHKVITQEELKKLEGDKPLDAKTMLLYSRALDAIDHKDKTKAVELLTQVIAKAPAFGAAKEKRDALAKSSP